MQQELDEKPSRWSKFGKEHQVPFPSSQRPTPHCINFFSPQKLIPSDCPSRRCFLSFSPASQSCTTFPLRRPLHDGECVKTVDYLLADVNNSLGSTSLPTSDAATQFSFPILCWSAKVEQDNGEPVFAPQKRQDGWPRHRILLPVKDRCQSS